VLFLVAAAPMRRYQVFGPLFAAAPDGVFRLDRDPVTAQPPVPPMTKGNKARHLSAQTALLVRTLDVYGLKKTAQIIALNKNFATAITLDCLTDEWRNG